jgi:hypothetical protein
MAWLEVWLQGGEADDYRYPTFVELPDEIAMIRDERDASNWLRVLVESKWPGAVEYVRQRDVEQFDHERIYYAREIL